MSYSSVWIRLSGVTVALWPAVLAHQGKALRVVEQGCEVDRVHCGHDDRTPVFAGYRRPPGTVIIPESAATSLHHPGSRQEPCPYLWRQHDPAMLPSSPGDSMPAAIRMTSLTGRMAAWPAKHTFFAKSMYYRT